MISFVLATALATLVFGIAAYNFLTGRRLVRDFRDKLRLRNRSLSEWDEHWSAMHDESDLIVCLTTTPSRIHNIEATLKSLLYQTRRAKRIRLHVPDYSHREACPYDLPAWLKELKSVEIVHCKDDGPITKLIPALRDLPADQPILVVDDDMLYPPDMIAYFDALAKSEPDKAFTMSGWIVPDDLVDRPATLLLNLTQAPPMPLKCTRQRRPREIDVLQGYSGYLVRPRFFDLDEVLNYAGAPEEAYYVDDVWVSAHCKAQKYVYPHGRYPMSDWSKAALVSATSLGRINRGSGDPLERSNTIAVRHLPDRWITSRGQSGSGTR